MVRSLEKLVIPNGAEIVLCIADNNLESEVEGYIAEAMENSSLTFVASHEPVPGYSSARNKSLELGLQTGADYFLVTDDDLLVDPKWVEEHLNAFSEYNSDVNCGLQLGGKVSRVEGQIIEDVTKRVGTSNLAFRRLLIDPVGHAIKFDMAFNQSGGEDTNFLQQAKAKGAKIIWASKAQVFKNEPSWDSDPKGAFHAAMNLASIRRVKHHNDMVSAVQSRKWTKVAGGLLKTIPNSLSFLALYLASIASAQFNEVNSLKLKARSFKNWHKTMGSLQGLSGKATSRIAARRDDIDG